jgi:hypothetical protein
MPLLYQLLITNYFLVTEPTVSMILQILNILAELQFQKKELNLLC